MGFVEGPNLFLVPPFCPSPCPTGPPSPEDCLGCREAGMRIYYLLRLESCGRGKGSLFELRGEGSLW